MIKGGVWRLVMQADEGSTKRPKMNKGIYVCRHIGTLFGTYLAKMEGWIVALLRNETFVLM